MKKLLLIDIYKLWRQLCNLFFFLNGMFKILHRDLISSPTQLSDISYKQYDTNTYAINILRRFSSASSVTGLFAFQFNRNERQLE